MAEIDRLTLEIDSKAQTASSGIDSLISNLQKLSSITDTSAKNLKTIASSINSLKNSLNKLSQLDFDKVDQSITRLNTSLSSIKTSVKAFADTSAQIKTMTSALNSLNRAMDKLSKNQGVSNLDLSKMTFNVNQYQRTATAMNNVSSGMLGGANMLANIYMLSRIGNAFGTMIQKANDYIETMNLFSVVMGENTRQASEFVYSLEAIGVDMEQAMRYQASFYDIGKSLGLTAKNANTLSEQFTKLTYDYASLYNLPVEESFQKLQAAIVGTTEPIRRLGKDISIAKLEEVALNLGIEESVRNMTQAEKAELRFIAVMQQSTAAMNDMERTIDQPANALRVLKAQFTSLVRDLGNLFIPIVSAVLPYLIALAKFLREVVSGIAAFFGIDMFKLDFNTVNSSLGVADKYTSDLSDNLADGADSAKKIKDYMLGIDELNVLNKDTGTISTDTGAAGVGSGSGLGLDLEDFGYETLLKNVQSKADEILKTFEKWKPVLLTIAGILSGLWAVGKIYNFISALKGVRTTSTLVAGAQGLAALATSFFGLAGTGGVLGTVSTAFVALGDTILSSVGIMTGSSVVAGLTGFAVVLGVVALAGLGIYEAMQPAIEQVDEFAYVSEETKNKLEPVIDTWKDLEKEITKLDWSDKVITDEDVDSIVSKTENMVDSVLNEVDADRNQALQDIELLQGVETISPKTYRKMMNQTSGYYDDIESETKAAEEEINRILSTASSEKRALKESEVTRLRELEQQIRDNAVNIMTESEEEQMMIMTRLKHNQEALTVETASELLQEAKKNYDEQVTAAEDWRTRMLMQLDQRFGDEATMSNAAYKEQYDAIQAAYNDQISEAKTSYDEINETVKNGLGDQQDNIDYATGKIKSNWDKFWGDVGKGWNSFWDDVNKGFNSWMNDTMDNWNNWKKDFQKGWDNFWGGLGTWWGNITTGLGSWWNDITTKFNNWKSSIGTGWNNFWSGLDTWWDQTTDGLQDWWDNITSGFNSWLGSLGDKWNNFWGGLANGWNNFWGGMGSWWEQNAPSWLGGGKSRMSVGVDTVSSISAPSVMAFARGGFVPSAANFVSPDMWTAGEAGKELVGSYQGRTTVMPLENTSFVSAMYQAIYQATRDAYGENETTVIVQPKVEIGGKEIKQAEQEYQYSSGGGLIKKK